jgi:hypothetical protein
VGTFRPHSGIISFAGDAINRGRAHSAMDPGRGGSCAWVGSAVHGNVPGRGLPLQGRECSL